MNYKNKLPTIDLILNDDKYCEKNPKINQSSKSDHSDYTAQEKVKVDVREKFFFFWAHCLLAFIT